MSSGAPDPEAMDGAAEEIRLGYLSNSAEDKPLSEELEGWEVGGANKEPATPEATAAAWPAAAVDTPPGEAIPL